MGGSTLSIQAIPEALKAHPLLLSDAKNADSHLTYTFVISGSQFKLESPLESFTVAGEELTGA